MVGGVLSSCRCRRSSVLLRELEFCRELISDTCDPFLRRSSGVNERDSGVSERCLRRLLDELCESLRSGVSERCRCVLKGEMMLTLPADTLGN